MNAWILVQILIDLMVAAGVITIWIRLNRPVKDDPRMSKGLQLLQSKISILEDLSDRTDVQVQQLTALLENKCKEIQEKITDADRQLHRIDQNLRKSLEVTEIFQDRIPHQEIIERQNTIKYVKAAKMAHEGKTVEEIAQVVDLSRGELEMIAKVNKEQLMFSEASLPTWAVPAPDEFQSRTNESSQSMQFQQGLAREIPMNLERAFDLPSNQQEALKKLGEKFKQVPNLTPTQSTAQATQEAFEQSKVTGSETTVVQNGKTLHVKPFEFRKIDFNGNLS